MPPTTKPNILMILTGLAVVGLCTLSVQLFLRRQTSQAASLELDHSLEETFPASDPVSTY